MVVTGEYKIVDKSLEKPVQQKPVQQKKEKDLIGIQYLRAIAVILVVLYHITTMAKFDKYFGIDILNAVFTPGAVGVELFFVISGFIITYVSLSEYSLIPKITPSVFIQRRLLRIIPFMWLCVIGYALLRFMGRGTFPFYPYLRSLLLFPVGDVQPNQIWTLRHEFLFYGIFCLSVIKFKSNWTFLILWFVSPLVWYGQDLRTHFNESWVKELFDFMFSRLNILFGIGVVIGLIYLKGIYKKQYVTRYGFVICLIASCFLFFTADYTGLGEGEIYFTPVIATGIVSFFLILVSLPIQVKNLSYVDHVGSILGNASYSIYLTHSAVISMSLGIWSKIQPLPNQALVVVALLISCCVIGVIVHEVIEKPLIKFIQTHFSFLKVPIKFEHEKSEQLKTAVK